MSWEEERAGACRHWKLDLGVRRNTKAAPFDVQETWRASDLPPQPRVDDRTRSASDTGASIRVRSGSGAPLAAMSPLGATERFRRTLFDVSRALRRTARRLFGLPPDWYAVQRLGQFQDPESRWQPPGQFAELFANHRGRVAHKWIHYFEIYDRLLERFTDGVAQPDGSRRPLHFLEIGVAQGGSLELWREKLGPEAVIFGIDIDPNCATIARDDLQVRIGSQADPDFLRSVVAEMGGIDVVLDDGSHVALHQRVSFDTLFPLLSASGLYVVEDTHTAYFLDFGGGLRRRGTIIEVAKGMVDGLNKWYFRAPVGGRAKMAWRDVVSIQFFDSIVAFEKGPRRRPEVRMTTPAADPR